MPSREGSTASSFWEDYWLPGGPIFVTHLALFSHPVRPNVSVSEVFQSRIDLHLRPQLTGAAHSELAALISTLQDVQLDGSSDIRLMLLTGKRFNTKDAYSVLRPSSGHDDLNSKYIWGSAVPNKVKIFSWLYFKDRLSSRVNLFRKHVLEDDKCERCSNSVEDRHHIFFGCPSISTISAHLGMSAAVSASDEDIWHSGA